MGGAWVVHGCMVVLILLTLLVEYSDQLLGAARQVHVVYLAHLLGAVLFIHIYIITIFS